jgi:hypothetical protein
VYFGGKPLPWNLYDANDKLVESGEVPKDKEDHRVEFKATAPGLYRFVVEDGGSGTAYAWPANAKVSISTSAKYPAKFNYALTKQRLYFYVPKKTEQIVIFRTAAVQWKIHDPAGKLVFTSEPHNGHIVVPVPPAQRGAIWSIVNAGGRNIKFLTTPPVVAFSPAGLLLPKELKSEIAL